MKHTLSVFWSFRSPYSYIALPRIEILAKEFELEVDMRIVHPNILRNPNYFKTMNVLARPYFMLDTARVAAFQGMPFRRPVPDPISQDPVTLNVAAEQPLARWLGRLGVEACLQGKGLAFAREVSTLLWDGKTDQWNQSNHMQQATERAGLDWLAMVNKVESEPQRYEAILTQNDEALKAYGHWGVPTMVYGSEPFFGQDRIEVLAWRVALERK